MAQAPFATEDDLATLGVQAEALTGISSAAKAQALLAATYELAGYLTGYVLPITAWGADLRLHTTKLAAHTLLTVRGLNPDGEDVKQLRTDALEWGTKVAEGKIRPIGIVDSTPDDDDFGAGIYTDAARAW